jgi:hypothetical protein
MDLDPDSVKLPLHRGQFEARHRVGHVGAGRGEHRKDRPEDLEPDRAQTRLALGHRDLRHPREIARQHQRPARGLTANACCLGHRVGHHTGQRALAELAGEQPTEERGFVLGGAPEQVGEQATPRPHRSGSGSALDLVDRPVHLHHRQRGDVGRANPDRVDRRIPDADAALAGSARQEPDADRDLIRFELHQQLGENRDLARPRAGFADERRCGDHIGEQRHALRSTSRPRLAHASPRRPRGSLQTGRGRVVT